MKPGEKVLELPNYNLRAVLPLALIPASPLFCLLILCNFVHFSMFQRIGCCRLCLSDIAGYKSLSLPCWHIFHVTCLKNQMRINYCCPVCLIPFTSKLHPIRLSKRLRSKEYLPTLHPIEEILFEESDDDPRNIFEPEDLDPVSFEYSFDAPDVPVEVVSEINEAPSQKSFKILRRAIPWTPLEFILKSTFLKLKSLLIG